MSNRRSRAGGRAARVASRMNPGEEVPNPAPSGLPGGQYRPLTESQCAAIVDAAFRLLATIGIGDVPEVVLDLALARGCKIDSHGRLIYSRDFVEDIIASTPKSLTLFGQDPKHDFEVSKQAVRFGTGGAAVQTLDLESGAYRPSTLRDVYDFARLADQLENICWFTRCCVATDMADIFDLDVNTAYAIASGTTKPIGNSFSFGSHVDACVDLFDMILGEPGAFKKRPFCKAHISPIISPMRYGEDAVDVAQAALRHNMPVNTIIAAQSGATAPAPLAGMLAQSLAETLAALVLIDLLKPGHPVIFSNWPFVVDLRTGAFAGGSAEMAILNAGSAQLTNSLGLISGVAASMTDSKLPDAQAGYEKGLTTLAAGLAGGNLVYESAGMFGSLLGVSFEGFVIDNDILGSVQRVVRGVEVNGETLNLDAIEQAIRGEGHFLGGDQTLAAMQRDYFYPPLSDRNSPDAWAEAGGVDMQGRAKERARALLSQHFPTHISAATDDLIRARHKIHFPKEHMH
ncbi:trimethylamine methyltransferase family protein [Pacificoceanicola onchidii]|uniref:trimethylamine methyltransferase family protein n=1 Tax=Pacificoceanicola onchidii TaxID=2562685 RepID=UPI0010A326EB|nr:trimethylamine methyltransferase family protein [Pacificoceanicola onchidii]